MIKTIRRKVLFYIINLTKHIIFYKILKLFDNSSINSFNVNLFFKIQVNLTYETTTLIFVRNRELHN